eukprot:gene2146-2012_t
MSNETLHLFYLENYNQLEIYSIFSDIHSYTLPPKHFLEKFRLDWKISTYQRDTFWLSSNALNLENLPNFISCHSNSLENVGIRDSIYKSSSVAIAYGKCKNGYVGDVNGEKDVQIILLEMISKLKPKSKLGSFKPDIYYIKTWGTMENFMTAYGLQKDVFVKATEILNSFREAVGDWIEPETYQEEIVDEEPPKKMLKRNDSKCQYCKKTGVDFQICSWCQNVCYCSKKCLQLDSTNHQQNCLLK